MGLMSHFFLEYNLSILYFQNILFIGFLREWFLDKGPIWRVFLINLSNYEKECPKQSIY